MSRTPGRYGADRSQRADLWLPSRAVRPPGPLPVVVLVHGGFWRVRYTKVLMRGLARAATHEGWAALNVEYRRVGMGGGWPRSFFDVAAAIDRLHDLADAGAPLDLDRVVTCGHSAGGLLALWAAAREQLPGPAPSAPRTPGTATARAPAPPVRIAAAVSLAGVVDVAEASRLGLGGGAVDALLGGSPEEVPDRYRLADPASWLPLGIPQVLIHGADDDIVPLALTERYADQARAAGDPVELKVLPRTGHRDLIRARGASWAALRHHLGALFAPR